VTGSEEEMLFDFIGSQLLHRELLQDVFNSIPSGPEKQNQIAEIKMLVNRTVTTAVDRTWKKTLAFATPLLSPQFFLAPSDPLSAYKLMQVALQDDSTESRVSALHAIFGETYFLKFYNTVQVEQEIQNKVCAALASIVDPVIMDVASTTCAPLLQAILESVITAFSEAVDGYRSDMETIVVALASGEPPPPPPPRLPPRTPSNSSSKTLKSDDPPTPPGSPLAEGGGSGAGAEEDLFPEADLLASLLDAEHLSVSGAYHSGPLQAARATLWTMYTSNLNQSDVLICFSQGGLTAYDVYTRVTDSIVSLTHNGIYTFGLLLRQAMEKSEGSKNYELCAERVYIQCVNMMASDSMAMTRKTLVDILKRCLSLPLSSLTSPQFDRPGGAGDDHPPSRGCDPAAPDPRPAEPPPGLQHGVLWRAPHTADDRHRALLPGRAAPRQIAGCRWAGEPLAL
jgi:hypothetical protein